MKIVVTEKGRILSEMLREEKLLNNEESSEKQSQLPQEYELFDRSNYSSKPWHYEKSVKLDQIPIDYKDSKRKFQYMPLSSRSNKSLGSSLPDLIRSTTSESEYRKIFPDVNKNLVVESNIFKDTFYSSIIRPKSNVTIHRPNTKSYIQKYLNTENMSSPSNSTLRTKTSSISSQGSKKLKSYDSNTKCSIIEEKQNYHIGSIFKQIISREAENQFLQSKEHKEFQKKFYVDGDKLSIRNLSKYQGNIKHVTNQDLHEIQYKKQSQLDKISQRRELLQKQFMDEFEKVKQKVQNKESKLQEHVSWNNQFIQAIKQETDILQNYSKEKEHIKQRYKNRISRFHSDKLKKWEQTYVPGIDSFKKQVKKKPISQSLKARMKCFKETGLKLAKVRIGFAK